MGQVAYTRVPTELWDGLMAAAHATLRWAREPGDHGGNPYFKEHVNEATIALGKVDKYNHLITEEPRDA